MIYINFYEEVVPFIKEYKNLVFRAFDGYGAEILFSNGLSIAWDEENSQVTEVRVQFKQYCFKGNNEVFYVEVLNMAKMFAQMEIEQIEYQRKIDEQYNKMIKLIMSKSVT